MMNCNFNNCYLYILIILLLLCCNGCVTDIIGKLCDCKYLIPLALVYFCCCGDKKGFDKGFGGGFGCGCGK